MIVERGLKFSFSGMHSGFRKLLVIQISDHSACPQDHLVCETSVHCSRNPSLIIIFLFHSLPVSVARHKWCGRSLARETASAPCPRSRGTKKGLRASAGRARWTISLTFFSFVIVFVPFLSAVWARWKKFGSPRHWDRQFIRPTGGTYWHFSILYFFRVSKFEIKFVFMFIKSMKISSTLFFIWNLLPETQGFVWKRLNKKI